MDDLVAEEELTKVKNQAEASIVFSEIELLNRAMNLAHSKLLGDANLINLESEKIQAVTTGDILQQAKNICAPITALPYFTTPNRKPKPTRKLPD